MEADRDRLLVGLQELPLGHTADERLDQFGRGQ